MHKNLLKLLGVLLFVGAILFSMFYFVGTPNTKDLNIVQKTKYLNSTTTYIDAFNNYFTTPKWLGFVDKNGNPVIQFSGYDTTLSNTPKILLQWVVTSKKTYKLCYFSIDDKKQNLDTFSKFNDKIYDTYLNNQLKKQNKTSH